MVTENLEEMFIVGVSGLLFEDHVQKEADIIKGLFDTSIDHSGNIIILGNFINCGISKVAYDWAYERDLLTLGVATPKCWEHPCRMVHNREIVGQEWGDEIDLFTDVCHGLLNFWHTDHSLATMKMAQRKGKRVIDLTDVFTNQI